MTMSAEKFPQFVKELSESKNQQSENIETIKNRGRDLEVSKQLNYHFVFQSFDTDLRKLLVQVTGQTDTESISRVKIKVVTKQAGLHRLADYTPRLKVLVLDGSCVDSLRDLGSELKNLETLSVVRCNLKSLDGLWGFRSLQSFVARDNFIKDPSPCSGVDGLVNLDLANNEIEDPRSFAFLRSCRNLRILDVTGNRFDDYKEIIKRLVPQICGLDGEDIEATDTVAREDSEDEITFSDLTSEDEEFLFLPGDEIDGAYFPVKAEMRDFRINQETNSKKHLCIRELGAGDDEFFVPELNENFFKKIEKDDANQRAEERNLDSFSSSIFVMNHELDNVLIIDSSSTNVGEHRHSLETIPSKLPSGRAICGNLAASLRPRNSSKNPFTLSAARTDIESGRDDNNSAKN